MIYTRPAAFCFFALSASAVVAAELRPISEAELRDKLDGFWQGQLVGNFAGLPFENRYRKQAMPIVPDRYYDFRDEGGEHGLVINTQDMRGSIPQACRAFEGAFADDDTDIELVTLHAVEKCGLDITYAEIAEAWKTHINRRIWVANRRARDLMEEGLLPPATGSKENNEHWFQIDPQLVNEIWSAFYPGMTEKAVARAEWAARITNDDWGVHPTLFYAECYSRAFFDDDLERIVRDAISHIPTGSPFREGCDDVLAAYDAGEEWRATRKMIFDRYFAYKKRLPDGTVYEAPVSGYSSLPNGLCGVLALLHGEGDFDKTVGIAIAAGLDNDNQAATCGGLVGVLHGASSIPKHWTHELANEKTWDRPFNNRYINFTRDGLKVRFTMDELTDRVLAIAADAIVEAGGEVEDGVFIVPTDF